MLLTISYLLLCVCVPFQIDKKSVVKKIGAYIIDGSPWRATKVFKKKVLWVS